MQGPPFGSGGPAMKREGGCLFFCLFVFGQVLGHPVLTFNNAGDQHGCRAVARAVIHGGKRIDQERQGCNDREQFGWEAKEVHNDDCADHTGAGDGRCDNTAENTNQNRTGPVSDSGKRLTCNGKHHCDLQNIAHDCAVHVRGCSERDHNAADILRYTDLLCCFQVAGHRCNRALRAEGSDRNREDLGEKGFDGRHFAGDVCKEKIRGKEIHNTKRIINQQCDTRIGAEQLLEERKAAANKQAAPAEEVVAPPKEVVTGAIAGIEIMDLEDAVNVLWKNKIYAESGMGCTGPVVLVSDANLEKSIALLKEAGYVQ